MVTGVSSGQAGRSIAADNFAWRLFWLLELAVLARVTAGVLAATGVAAATPLMVIAAIAWGGVGTVWALRYGGWYGRPRVDGRPG